MMVPDRAALRQESVLVACAAAIVSLAALAYCLPRGMLLLYGDAVAHLHTARRLTDSLYPGWRQLGSVWLPLPHLLIAPFVTSMRGWQSGIGGAPPSMLAYVLGAAGLYRLARIWLGVGPSLVTVVFYALNPGLVYMQVTAMNEPLFLAEMIWATLLVAEISIALADANARRAGRRMLALALLLAASVFTRYDGWIFAAACWCVVAWAMVRTRSFRTPAGEMFLLFTAIVVAAPAFWLAYNAKQFGDPLDFIRGPYSAKAIDARTTPPGAGHYPGWHYLPMAAQYFAKAAELGAAPLWAGDLLLILTLAGSALAAWKLRGSALTLLLWIPLPFYAYSVAYGSVPIFIPIWRPNSFYNTRYGMELLPIFALSLAFLAALGAEWMDRRRPAMTTPALGLLLALLVLNDLTLLRAQPLVYQEAVANSRTRIAFEEALARALVQLPPRGAILMYTSDHVGAVERAGIPLARTINDSDYLVWNSALADPAHAAAFVVAIDGDAVAKSVAAHPSGLALLDVVCSTGQPCAHVYTSTVSGAHGNAGAQGRLH
jgi:hypothetical protein